MDETPLALAVIDDSDLFRQTLVRLIARLPRLSCVAEGEAATDLPRVLTAKPDVVFVDLNLGGSRGVDLVLQIREAAPATRVVLISGNVEPEMARRALDEGAAACLMKDRVLPLLKHLSDEGLAAFARVRD
ncbi:MAG: response regulator transcription factor [Pseudomonadales bacterium]|nr:response regulator transcription factor [Pseudomonadales bacterium]